MNQDERELESMTHLWNAETPSVPMGLAEKVRREGVWLRVHAALALTLVAGFLGGSLWAAVHFGSTEWVVLAIGVWMVSVYASIYQWQNGSATWTPESETTEAFVRLSLRRCRASLRGVRFGLWLLLVEVLLLGAWQAWYWSSRAERPTVETWVWAAMVPLVLLVALLGLRTYRRSELARLEQLERELDA